MVNESGRWRLMSSDTEIDPSGSACPKKLSAAFGRIAATRPRITEVT
jgi:hypothetical protein